MEREKTVTAVIGCPPLPGSPLYERMARDVCCAYVDRELETLVAGGIKALMLQNIGDLPVPVTARAETIAWMAMLGARIRERFDGFFGVSLLEDDPVATLSIAQAAGANFVRLKVFVGVMTGPDGIREGTAYHAQRHRALLGARDIAIFADVYDRTRWPVEGDQFEAMVHEAIWYGKADGLVITGRSPDQTFKLLQRARQVTDVPLWVGGGVDELNVRKCLAHADGVIVATSLKSGQDLLEPFNHDRVRVFVEAANHDQSTESQ